MQAEHIVVEDVKTSQKIVVIIVAVATGLKAIVIKAVIPITHTSSLLGKPPKKFMQQLK